MAFTLSTYFSAREGPRRLFAHEHGYRDFAIAPLYEDMASRHFYRLSRHGHSAVLMDSLPDAHPQATPGHKIHDYLRLARALKEQGLHTPEIYAVDEESGFVLMEDLGDAPINDEQLPLAVNALIDLRKTFPDNTLALPDYFASHIHAGHRRVVDWYMPCVRLEQNPDGWVEEYLNIWRGIEKQLPPPLPGFVHADFHRGNLRHVNDACGILDFQGAQWGPVAYDLVNLLEDARIKTDTALKPKLKQSYTQSLAADQRTGFDQWYTVLSAQFHCRTIGQFIKLAVRGGKRQYLPYIPLVQDYLCEELSQPLLAPLQEWFLQHGVDFSGTVEPQPLFIRDDAF